MTDITNPCYEGMYTLWQYGHGYHLDGDAFTPEITDNILKETQLRKSSWLGDWWVHIWDNPELTWKQLIDLALHILHTEATRLFMHHIYLKTFPNYTVHHTQEQLPCKGVRGAKRINAYCGKYEAFNFLQQAFEGEHDIGNKFRLSGKDESCCVEGTWYDWCCFACNVLASENTKLLCPDLHEPLLANDNY